MYKVVKNKYELLNMKENHTSQLILAVLRSMLISIFWMCTFELCSYKSPITIHHAEHYTAKRKSKHLRSLPVPFLLFLDKHPSPEK